MAIPGLPALAGDVFIDTVALIAQDVLAALGVFSGPQWGLFLDGQPAVVSDNVVAFEFKQDFRISNYPVEQGAFESYNKVKIPYDVRLRFSTGGSVADRQAMIDSVDAIIGSTDLFDAVTPEKVYQNLNPVHQDIRRTARDGVGLLVIDLFCEEVRVTATPQFTSSQQASASSSNTTTVMTIIPGSQLINNPQSPSAAPQVSDGTVQTTTAAPGQFDLSQALP